MVKDYAKRIAPQPPRKKRGFPTGIVIFIVILLPLLLFYFNFQKAIHRKKIAHSHSLIKTNAAHKNSPVTAQATQNQNSEETNVEYDFYTLLPKMAVELPPQNQTDEHIASPPSVKAQTVVNHNPNFLLQVAAFRNLQEAQHLQARLFNLGFRVFTQPYQSHNAIWYRVLIGPYSDTNNLAQDQARLRQFHLQTILLKLKPTT